MKKVTTFSERQNAITMKFRPYIPSLKNRITVKTSPALLALLLVTIPASLALAGEDTRYYDRSGRYQGRATTNTANPKQKSLYDPHGRYVGRVMTDDKGNARVYDQHGKYMGRTTGSPTLPDKTK